MWCVYTVKFYSIIRKNEIMSHADKWMELEDIMLGKPDLERQRPHFPSYVKDRSKHDHIHTYM
jgi:hypothetical protein